MTNKISMKTVHDDKATRAIWKAVSAKCGEEGIGTLYEWLGDKIHRTAKTAENKLVTGDWTPDDIEQIIVATGRESEIRQGVSDRLALNK